MITHQLNCKQHKMKSNNRIASLADLIAKRFRNLTDNGCFGADAAPHFRLHLIQLASVFSVASLGHRTEVSKPCSPPHFA